jgi:hypothetical protein
MIDGPPYPRATALAVARKPCEILAPLCLRIAVGTVKSVPGKSLSEG